MNLFLLKAADNLSVVDEKQITEQADSAKAALADMADLLAKDPNAFLTQLGEHALNFGTKLLAAIVIYIIGAWLIKRVKNLMKKFFAKRNSDKTLTSFITSLVTITLTVILIIVTIGTLGINTTSLAALLAAGGMAIGMALSGTAQNFAGGLMILLFRPFKIGDYIKAQGYEGYVVEVSIVNTKIRTYANSIIILPNGALFNGNIDNFTDKPVHRCQWSVCVSYGSDVQQVREIVLGIIKSDPRVIDSTVPGAADPSVNLEALNDSSVGLVARCWVNTGDYWSVFYSIYEKIYTELPQKGISFPFPQMDVHIDNTNPSLPA